MFQTSARIVATGLAAVTLGALSGWVLIDKLHHKTTPATASAASIVAPAPSVNAGEPVSPKPEPVAATPAPPTPPAATDARTPAPARVAAPAANPTPAAKPAPAADPDSTTRAKPHINVDKDRGEASIDVGGAKLSASKDGKMRIKMPGGGTYDIDW
jgi:outer membrane biosynthesis protein TonB